MNGAIKSTGTFKKVVNSTTPNTTTQMLFDFSSLTNTYNNYATSNIVTYYITLETLEATINLQNSLLPSPVPDTSPLDSFAQRQGKITEIENHNQRIRLDLLLDTNDGNGLLKKSGVFLLNYQCEYYQPLLRPYLTLNNVRLMNSTDKLGYTLTDVGFGKVKGGDYIYIEGSWSLEVYIISKPF